jgi:asparagine synthase (glutamine-hydrolysing)
MCGIAGYIGHKKFSKKRIDEILFLMKRRGPDSFGFKEINELKKSLSLFFSRLSIIDQDKRANQPFFHKDKILIFNGEIYNYIELRNELKKKGYSFTTSADTEVLIKTIDCWGESGIKKLEGMWSFFFYDSSKKISLLSRDRFGEKPLFYYKKNNEFVFGSEIKIIKSILNKSFNINFNKIDDFLRYGYKSLNKNNDSYFKNIYSVPPGHYLKITSKKIETINYWKIKQKKSELSEKISVKELKEKLFKSIEIRLRSDCPIAFLLSGGIDSNSLVNIASKVFGYKINSFSVLSKNPKYDESELIDYSLKNIKSNHENLKINFKECNFIDNLNKQINYHDSPVTTINSFLQFLLLNKVKKSGFKVCMSGIGSDEIFSGYYDHHLLYLNEIRNKKKLFSESVENWKNNIKPITQNPYLQNFDLYINNSKFRNHVYQCEDFKKKIFIRKKNFFFKEENYVSSLMKNRMINELRNETVPIILKEDDLNSMYYSIENRSPYLDTNLFQSCLDMPSEYYIKNSMAKWPLRQIVKNLVPDKIRLNKRKIGFNAPIHEAFDLNNKKNMNFLLKDSPIFKMVNKSEIKKLLGKSKFSGVENNFIFSFISSKIFIENFS